MSLRRSAGRAVHRDDNREDRRYAGPNNPAGAAPARSRQEPRVHEAAVGAVGLSSGVRALSGWDPRERFMTRGEFSTENRSEGVDIIGCVGFEFLRQCTRPAFYLGL